MAQASPAWMMFSVDEPDTGLAGHSFVDILYHEGTLWLASGRGLSYSTNMGMTWYTRTTETNPGLASDEPSALFGRPGEVWIAGSHFEVYDGISYPFGDGFSMSADNTGEIWELYEPFESSDFARLAYDLDGTESMIVAACFYGGLIVRHDPDTAWEHLFYSPADSLDWVADGWAGLSSGRYYACAVDTTHADTLVVYGGSARGINKFLYIPKRVKMGGKMIYDIVPTGEFIYFASEGGITQADTATLGTLYTADAGNGLGSDWIKTMTVFGGKLWAAPFDPVDSSGLGLYVLDNPESEWTEIGEMLSGPPDLWTRANAGLFEGINGGVHDFKVYFDSAVYIAAGDSGLYRSLDSGATWNRFYVDPLDTDQSSPRNQVYSIDITPDSMFLGTRAGLVIASYIEPLAFTYDTLVEFEENDSTGSWVTLVRHQDDDSASFTYVGLEPQTEMGNPGAYFVDPWIDPLDPDSTIQLRKTLHLIKTKVNDIHIVNEDLTVLAADSGLYGSINIRNPLFITPYSVADLTNGLTLNSFRFLSAQPLGDRLFVGSSGGHAYGIVEEDVLTWYVRTVNTDPDKHDLAVAITSASFGLPGNWVVALEAQKYDTGAVLWAGCRRVSDTLQQYNSIGISRDYGDTWQMALQNEQVWNFAFDANDKAYAAASSGLFAADPPAWDVWERLNIVDPVTQDTIAPGTEIFSVEVAEDVIWVGTELGLARRNIDQDSSWTITRNFKATDSEDDVFAAPVPYSPINNNGRLSIHYPVEQSGEVTVEIYDFAMNLVRVLAENRYRDGGGDYFETWDGYNGRGDMVAVGIYYIKVAYSAGEIRWGRLAIIP
jgi:hypothetical protein